MAVGTAVKLLCTLLSLFLSADSFASGAPRLLSSDVQCGGEVLLWGVGLPSAAVLAAQLTTTCSLGSGGGSGSGLAVTCDAAVLAGPYEAERGDEETGMSAAEMAEVAAAHQFDPLPDGYTFDGCR
jgi:hypothetical protein